MSTEQSTRSYADHSAIVAFVRGASSQLRAWVAASWFVRLGAALGRRFDVATETSRLVGAFRMLERWIRHSFVYRWLTKEPDPDVIVIDLRETHTVGPFIAVLDRLAPLVERIWLGSLVRRATERVKAAPVWTWVADSRTVSLLAAALEPPRSPEEHGRE
ncbi:hypothetical protein [Halorussus amylolyticus]|uniref:hypothetical protein n=1 Tax=Halorussus amylolyticus TaxID=1126242 RepID=UPI00104C8F11|nr:hypothetical protein [Halorussus amylolyticus]